MATWLNHVAIAAPRNATTTHTVSPSAGTVATQTTGGAAIGALFTPTAGNLLICVATAGVTSTTPTGWTLPTNGSAINNTGLYAWTKTAAGADSLTTTHNASNYPVVFHFFEFAAGSTFVGSASAINVANGGAGPVLTGLTGTNHLFFAASQGGTAVETWVWGVSTGGTGSEIADTGLAKVGTDGYNYSLAVSADSALTSASSTATSTSTVVQERLTFAVKIGGVTPNGTATSGTTWAGTATGSAPNGGTASSGTTWAGTSVGVTPVAGSGTAVSGTTWAGTSVGKSNPIATLFSGTTWAGTSVGKVNPAGTADSGTIWSGTAAGPSPALTIAQENALTGRGSQFWYDGVGSEQMPAFARSSYYTPGQTAEFSVDFGSSFTFEVYRLGHYAGEGARRLAGPTAGTPATQPAPVAITGGNGAVDCANWSKNVTWTIPSNATPGWYYLFLTNGSTSFGYALFCVSDKNAKKPILAVSGDATWHAAYNGYGGNNVYGNSKGVASTADNRAYCSSYDKPVITKDYVPQTHFFNASFASFKYLESLGVEVGYTTIEQINNDPTILDGRSVIIFSGHNEYVSQPVVDKTKALLSAGQRIINWAGNDFFWRVKFGSPAGMNTPGRVVWVKKDTLTGPNGSGHTAGTPFTTAADWTGTWQDTRWANREPSADYLGDRFIANGIRDDQVKVPFAMKTSPLWRNCAGVQALTSGQTFSFAAGSLGMEWDMPAGSLEQVRVSSSTVTLTNNSSDVNGEAYNLTTTAEHSIAVVRSGNGLVFNFNSDQWGKTLDNFNLRHGNIANVNARQACLNLLVDLGMVASSTMVTAASLTMPTPVTGELGAAYGLTSGPSVGTADSGTTWSGTSTGVSSRAGAAASGTTWSGAAAGVSPSNGTAASGTIWTGASTGYVVRAGTATSATVWSGASAGFAPTIGVPVGSAGSGTVWIGVSVGTRSSSGTATSGTTWYGIANGAGQGAPPRLLKVGAPRPPRFSASSPRRPRLNLGSST